MDWYVAHMCMGLNSAHDNSFNLATVVIEYSQHNPNMPSIYIYINALQLHALAT